MGLQLELRRHLHQSPRLVADAGLVFLAQGLPRGGHARAVGVAARGEDPVAHPGAQQDPRADGHEQQPPQHRDLEGDEPEADVGGEQGARAGQRPRELDERAVEGLQKLGPFGQGNQEPVLVLALQMTTTGKTGRKLFPQRKMRGIASWLSKSKSHCGRSIGFSKKGSYCLPTCIWQLTGV